MTATPWLTCVRGEAPLVVSLPHTGTTLASVESRLVSPWLARKDADWWIDKLYAFAADLGATVIRTDLSRTLIDVNRDPSGISLYPGQNTTELCPTTTFDGEPLYHPGEQPDAAEIAARRTAWFDPYHGLLRAEIERLRGSHAAVVLYDCHSIRSVIPRLFAGALPVFNLGTADGGSADPDLTALVERELTRAGASHVVNGRFKGGFITRSLGDPAGGVHALQMELACRGYMVEPEAPGPGSWPSPYDPAFAAATQDLLRTILTKARDWAGRAVPP